MSRTTNVICFSCTYCRPGLMQIYNSGGIHHLVKLLTSSVDAVLFFVISTLHNLLEHYVPSKMAICFAGNEGIKKACSQLDIFMHACFCLLLGGIQKMITLLSKDNVKFLTITIDCLYMLAYRHQDRKVEYYFSCNSISLCVFV